jgi:chemotaxis signal transduction protein
MASIGKKYILIKINEEQWAWPLQSSSQFFNIDYVLPLPKTEKYIAGLAYQHGRILTVIRADKLIGHSKSSLNIKQALWFDYRQDAYAILLDAGGEIVTVKNFSNDPQKKIFKKYFKHQAHKVYCLEPEEIMSILKIYD